MLNVCTSLHPRFYMSVLLLYDSLPHVLEWKEQSIRNFKAIDGKQALLRIIQVLLHLC